jgi:hypothetical protein
MLYGSDIQDNNDIFFSKSIDGGQTFSTLDNISNNDAFSNFVCFASIIKSIIIEYFIKIIKVIFTIISLIKLLIYI